MTTSNQIQTGDILTGQFVTNSDQKIRATVLERKGNFVKIKIDGESEIVRRKVYSHNSQEWVMPFGTYSMAPSIQKR